MFGYLLGWMLLFDLFQEAVCHDLILSESYRSWKQLEPQGSIELHRAAAEP